MKTRDKYMMPLMLVMCLFFVWAISANLLPTMIRQLMKTCELTPFEASFTETAYWIAYFICPVPIAMFMNRYSYKAGIVAGLAIAGAGAFLFMAAASLMEYWAYLCVFFIIATGMCFLETAANPYVTVLGDPSTASRRLNLAQSFNGLGAFIAAMFLSKLVLSGYSYTRKTLPADYPGGWTAYIETETASMTGPYAVLGIALLVFAVLFILARLPRIQGEGSGRLINFSVLRRRRLRNGVIAQFFYNGGQTAINSLFLVYCCGYAGLDESEGTTLFGIYMLAFLLGRWIGTMLMSRFHPHRMLAVYAAANVALCLVVVLSGGITGIYAMIAISFFMSIIYPTQFSIALESLGGDTKSGSAFLVMAIVGNAILPQLTALVMTLNPAWYYGAYVIPMICFGVCVWYAVSGCREEAARYVAAQVR